MKNLLLTLLFAAMASCTFAQKESKQASSLLKPNSFQINLGGHGLFYSLSYERFLINKPIFKTSVEVGLSYYPDKTGIIPLWMPININQLFTIKRNHHFELGIGHMVTYEPNNGTVTGYLTGRIGYRYQKPDGRFLFRAGFTPLFDYSYKSITGYQPLIGLSFGYSF